MDIASVMIVLAGAAWSELAPADSCFSPVVDAPRAASARVPMERPPMSAEEGVLIPDFRHVGQEPFVFVPHEGADNPVLTAEDVTDVEDCKFVADPFLFYEDGTWYIFLEVSAQYWVETDIAYATSEDALNWTYQRIVLDEPFCQSYPLVFKWNGEYYMITCHGTDDVRLYTTDSFPDGWFRLETLLEGYCFGDPSILRYDGMWWLLSSSHGMFDTYLHDSTSLVEPACWQEHPMSPVVLDDLSKARCGGRPIVFDHDRIIVYKQKCDVCYGEQVRGFEIDVLTKTEYAEHEIAESPILVPSGSGWNTDGMHQLSPWWTGQRWIAAVDAKRVEPEGGIWSIGIYASPPYVNESPTDPATPVGPVTVYAGFERSYTTSTSDPQGDDIYCRWDWGDETSGWMGPYHDGQDIAALHAWSEPGEYALRAQAKDDPDGDGELADGLESGWSLELPIVVREPGDVDGDWDVDTADLLVLLGAWGPNADHPADFNGDGQVNTADLMTLLGNWGP